VIDTVGPAAEIDALSYVEAELRAQRERAGRAVDRAEALHALLLTLPDLAHHHDTTTLPVEDILDAARSETERAELASLLSRIDPSEDQ
jgi:hypothetical protein